MSRRKPWYRRRWPVTVALFVSALAFAVPIAWASDLFGDVPDSNPFHDDIGAIARAGVTKGCDANVPPNYCPTDNVTRQAMAAFMHRGFGRVAFFHSTSEVTVPDTEQALWTTSITSGVPSGPLAGATGFIKGDAAVTIRQTDATGCPCEYFATLFVTEESSYLDGNWYADKTLTSAGQVAMLPITGALSLDPTDPSGSRTVEIHVFRFAGGSGSVAATAGANLTLTYFPFGSTGTNTLLVSKKTKLNGKR
jgi:hypothetical protein